MNSAIESLPDNLARRRLLNTEQVAHFVSRSVPEVRRLITAGAFPKPLKLNGRRLSWRLGDIVDWIDSKADQRQTAA